MRAYKNFGIGLLSLMLVFIGITAATGVFGLNSSTVYAQSPGLETGTKRALDKATDFCSDPVTGLRPIEFCEGVFKDGYIPGGASQAAYCSNPSIRNDQQKAGTCPAAYAAGVSAYNDDVRSYYPTQCQGRSGNLGEIAACKDGVDAKKAFQGLSVCNKYSGKEESACKAGFNNTDANITPRMERACKDHEDNNTYYYDCLAGFYNAANGMSLKEACDDRYQAGSDGHKACKDGFQAGDASIVREGDGNSCEGIDSVADAIGFFACPFLRGVGEVADSINEVVNDQLNFDVNQNLTVNVKQAWGIFRVLSTVFLVIIMLVMIFSQAIGSGPFEAYTIRKVLPKIVIAIILIQLSWVIFRFFVIVANDAGRGIQGLLAAPFGGQDELQLERLLGALGWEVSRGAATLGLLSVIAVTIINPWGAVLVAFTIAMGVLLALGTLLFRQALIIGCIIFAPLALVAWILPGTQRYWKMWWENFTKALILFPLIAGIIIIGRIFAWIVGSTDGAPGLIDLFAVLVGFFGPYYFLPKAFSWGGQAMSMAARGIEGGLKPLRDKGKEEFKGLGERRQGKYASKYNPSEKLGKRSLRRLQSGSFLPTERSRRLTIAKGAKWKSDRNEEAAALIDRVYEKAESEGYTDGQGNRMEPSVMAAKQALVDIIGNDKEGDADKRAVQASIKKFLDTNSWIELQKATITTRGSKFNGMKVADVPMWETTLINSPQHYGAVTGKRPDKAPHVIENTYGDTVAKANAAFERYGTVESTRQRVRDEMARSLKETGKITPQRLDKRDRMLYTLTDQMEPGNFPSVAQGLYQEIADLSRFEKEAAAAGHPVPEHKRVENVLRKKLSEIAGTGLQGQQIIGQLASGSVKEDVDKALGGDGTGIRIDRILAQAKSSTQQTGPAPTTPPPSTQPPGPGGPPPSSPGPAPTTPPPSTQPGGGGAGASAIPPGSLPTSATGQAAAIDYDALGRGVARHMAEPIAQGLARHTQNLRGLQTGAEGGVDLRPGDTVNPKQKDDEDNPPTGGA